MQALVRPEMSPLAALLAWQASSREPGPGLGGESLDEVGDGWASISTVRVSGRRSHSPIIS